MRDYLRLIATHTEGPRYDVTPLFENHEAFSALLDDLGGRFAGIRFDVVAGIDALGFILGAALAVRTGQGFVPIRKGGKLPVKADTAHFVDYTGRRKALELRADALQPGARVLVVDEWVETGARMKAAIALIEKQGGIIAGIATINVERNEGTRSLLDHYACYTVWQDA